MIEFSTYEVETLDNVIEVRNKLYVLLLDLNFHQEKTTQVASSVSQLLHTLLQIEGRIIPVRLMFMKEEGFYYLHVVIGCIGGGLPQPDRLDAWFSKVKLYFHEDSDEVEVVLKISDQEFIPNDSFIHEEQERLIQQSTGEMFQELCKKNEALMEALEELKTSSSMIQTEKMRALGSMTAGVAHELNNPMMGILNYVQYAIKHTDGEARQYKPLVDAEREVKRCQDIITNLLTFSRMDAEGEESVSKIKLSVLFERILKLEAYKLRAMDANVIKNYPDELQEPFVEVKVNKIQQVLLNLVGNAMHAVKTCEQRDLTLTLRFEEDEVMCSVSDTGIGMDEETQDKIFEPFFTTKQAGEGTGLGLAVSKSIVEDHDGFLTCESHVGLGTCFSVTLPLNNSDDR